METDRGRLLQEKTRFEVAGTGSLLSAADRLAGSRESQRLGRKAADKGPGTRVEAAEGRRPNRPDLRPPPRQPRSEIDPRCGRSTCGVAATTAVTTVWPFHDALCRFCCLLRRNSSHSVPYFTQLGDPAVCQPVTFIRTRGRPR